MTGLSARDRMIAVAVLAGAAILVGLAAHPGSGSGAPTLPPEPFMVLGQTALWLVIAVDLLMTAAIVYALFSKPVGLDAPPHKRHWTTHLMPLVPTLFAVVMILLMRPAAGGRGLFFLRPLTGLLPGQVPPTSKLLGAAPVHDLTWLSMVLAGLIVVVLLGWLFWPARPRKPAVKPAGPTAAESLVDTLDESLDSLLAIPDPRRAIIAAYSSMERSMERVGLPRQRYEAPMEFMARVLGSLLGLSTDFARLTYLFEVAKFSQHEIDEVMRSDSVVALSRIRAQLVASFPS